VFHLPSLLTLVEGAGFGVGYSTAYHGLITRGNLKKGETVLITGAGGGMGIPAVQIAKILGATVIAAASSAEKLEVLKQIGADHVINSAKENLRDRVAQITNNKFCDVVFENVGGDIFNHCVRCMAPNGRLLIIGFTSGKIPQFPINLALIKGFSLVGVRSGMQLVIEPELRKAIFQQLNKWAEEGKLKPHIGLAAPLDTYQEVISRLHYRTVTGKAVLLCRDFPANM